MASAKGKGTRVRLSPEARRDQLVGIAVDMLLTRPFDELGVDQVAEVAGVSRALIFHYFPTVRELRLAALAVAAEHLMVEMAEAVAVAEGEVAQLDAGVKAFVSFISQQPRTFDALAAMAASDQEFGLVFQTVRDQAAGLIQAAFGEALTPLRRKLAAGWVSLAETMVQSWVAEPEGIAQQELIDEVVQAARALLHSEHL